MATKNLNGAAKGSKGWLAQYPDAISHVTHKLSKQETKELEDLVDQWNTHGMPDEVKAMYVSFIFYSIILY